MTTTAAASVHPVDQKLPWGRTIIYAFQHVLAMYAGAVAVPLVLAGAVHLSTEELIYCRASSIYITINHLLKSGYKDTSLTLAFSLVNSQ